jgi:hypothetical protein
MASTLNKQPPDRLGGVVDRGAKAEGDFAGGEQERLEMPWLRPVATALAPEIDV